MTTAVVLFTRDLRVHDHPALTTACRDADRVVPLFVLDETVLARHGSANRTAHLLDALHDLRAALRARGGELVVRRGDTVEEVRRVVVEVGADRLELSADVSGHARRREIRLRQLGRELGVTVRAHPGITVVPPGGLMPAGRDHFRVFTPYWRRWSAQPHRRPLPPPTRVPTPARTAVGAIPVLSDLVLGTTSPALRPGGETVARRELDAWFDHGVDDYGDRRDELTTDTSRLSAHLHLGTLSAAELAARADRRRRGHDAFLRQLCWRDFNHQLLAANPDLPSTELRPRGDRWHDDEEAVAAWREGRTGYPVVDAGMRQLLTEGWMHNRARMVVASFLTRHLYVDWRVGAAHFMRWLVDGDLANNTAQWQWAAGVGTDTRPGRMLSPVAQGRRHDPTGAYVRQHVPELADVDLAHLHAPWECGRCREAAGDYPPPIVDHAEARARYLQLGRR